MEQNSKELPDITALVLGEQSYFYKTAPFQVVNSLGFIKAVITEYTVTGPEGDIYRLFKTDAGSWYDIDGVNQGASQQILHQLKTEIENSSNNNN